MSRDLRKGYFNRVWDRDRNSERDRDRGRDRDRSDYRSRPPIRKGRSRSPPKRRDEPKRSRSPRKNDKDIIDENILSEISKLPEPSELWDSQFQEGGFGAPPPPSFTQPEAVPNPSYSGNYQPPYSGIYDEFPSVGPPQPPHPPDIAAWNQMSLPPPPSSQPPPAPPAPFLNNVEDQIKKEAAIESEMRHQKAALSKQREDYIKKANILKKELDTLKDQRNELRGDPKRSPSPDTKRFLKENTKLQLEIQNKLKTIYNVVDMLNGIIGEEALEIHDSDDSAERSSKRKSRSPSANKKFNYIYYDPEMHWCRVCNEFPPTAKDYLNHLHSAPHHKMAAAHLEAPWHTVSGANEGFPSYPSAPTKRTPIKGLQFFVPSTAWYCKLCDQFIGDLHCASAHLKSVTHAKNYTNFVEQNPHWETDWMSDRQKAFEKSRANKAKSDGEKPQQYTAHTITFSKDGFHTKRANSPSASEDKKKKDKKKKSKRKKSRSSSSSSNSSSSESEKSSREKSSKKKSKDKKHKSGYDIRDDKSLSEWVSNIKMDRLNDSDRKLLDSLKSRMKKDESSKRRSTERNRSASRDRERIAEIQKELRKSERRESRTRDERDRRKARVAEEERESRAREDRESRAREERERRREDTRDSNQPQTDENKKPSAEVKKMPFIGKMPVYKNLTKNSKTEDQKKEDMKKKEDDEVTKKRREEMDAEIQKKVAEFKEKIARAQLEREQAQAEQQGIAGLMAMVPGIEPRPTPEVNPAPNPGAGLLPNPYLPPPGLAVPTSLGQPVPPRPAIPAQGNQSQGQLPQQPALPKDFQDALDIIFPSEVKNQEMNQADLFSMAPGFMPGIPGVMPPFPGLPLMNPQMFGFDMNPAPLFQPRPQLYDSHVPLVPSPKPRHQAKRQFQKNDVKKKDANKKVSQNEVQKNDNIMRKKEEMDDLAMLGIDASDVGAGI